MSCAAITARLGENMKRVLPAAALAALVSACAALPWEDDAAPAAEPAVEAAQVFPAARGLARAEDGVVLADGRIVVADQRHGLSVIGPDESVRPFGNFAEAGYKHVPDEAPAAPNGVSLEPDGAHILVADVYTGAIYRTNVATEETARVYQHTFGVNTAVRDSTGALWFTQSTKNRAGPKAEERLTAPFNESMEDGALYRIAPATGRRAPKAKRVLSGLCFGNGIVIDEARAALYVNESCGNRVNAFRLSLKDGVLSERRTLAEVLLPDNIELDASGMVWVASLVRNEIVMIDPGSGQVTSVFRGQTADNDRISAEWRRRSEARLPVLDLFAPPLWAPLPGPVTGVILSPGDGPVYVSNLGDALIRIARPAPAKAQGR